MSYDLTFIRRRPKQSWKRALAAAEKAAGKSETLTAEDLNAWNRIVPQVLALLDVGPSDVQIAEDPEFRELSHDGTGVSVQIYVNEAAITVPYWFIGEEARRTINLMYSLAEVVGRETGLEGWDQQLECGTADVDSILRARAVEIFEQVYHSLRS